MKIAVISSNSFIGKNLIENLKNIQTGKNRTRPNLSVSEIYSDEINDADAVIILPGTAVVPKIMANKKIIFISPLHGCENEGALPQNALIYRLPEIVGKWQGIDGSISKLCYAVANDEEYTIEHNNMMSILFVEDFVEEMFDALEDKPHRCDFPAAGEFSSDYTSPYDGITPVPNQNGKYCYSPKSLCTTLGTVEKYLKSFDQLNSTLIVPEIPADSLAYKLFSMYLSYLPEKKMSYPVKMSVDNRGVFTELVKTTNNGQVSINIARPGNVRGQHWHNTKWEIFIVVSGHGLIQQREIGTDKVYNFEVRGEEMRAVIMLPGYAHNIINLEKDKDLVTVMFANEQFDPNYPDTFFEIVDDTLDLL